MDTYFCIGHEQPWARFNQYHCSAKFSKGEHLLSLCHAESPCVSTAKFVPPCVLRRSKVCLLVLQGQAAPWQYNAHSHANMNRHFQNGYSSGLASADMILPHSHAKQEDQSMPQVTANGRGLSHDAAGWNGQFQV